MGNCLCCRRRNKIGPSSDNHKKIVLILVGLDNAGKTTVIKRLMGEPVKTLLPTVGFSSASLKYKGYTVKIYDLGGGHQIRGIWPRYFMDAHGVIFVVDASDIARLDECRSIFEGLLSHEKLSGKPILLLANKQDCVGALDELDIVERLNVESVVNDRRCPTLVETCSAGLERSTKHKIDPAIQSGYKWLLNCIITNYQNINARVERDTAEQKRIDDEAKKDRLERVQKIRQEREGTTNQNGAVTMNHQDELSSDGGDVVTENPFRPISEILVTNAEETTNKDILELVQDTGYPNVASDATNSRRFVKRVSNGSISFGEDKSLLSKIRSSVDISINKSVKGVSSATETAKGKQEGERHGSAKSPPPSADMFSAAAGGDKVQQLPPLRVPGQHTMEPWAKPMFRPPSRDSAWDLDKSLEVVAAPEGTDIQNEGKS